MHISTERVLFLIKDILRSNKGFGELKVLDMDKKEVTVRIGTHYRHTEPTYKFRINGNRLFFRGKSRTM